GASQLRLAGMLRDHFQTVWAAVRRFGVPPRSAEDAAQEVFIIAASKLGQIQPGRERQFLYAVAARVASNFRRATIHLHEGLSASSSASAATVASATGSAGATGGVASAGAVGLVKALLVGLGAGMLVSAAVVTTALVAAPKPPQAHSGTMLARTLARPPERAP